MLARKEAAAGAERSVNGTDSARFQPGASDMTGSLLWSAQDDSCRQPRERHVPRPQGRSIGKTRKQRLIRVRRRPVPRHRAAEKITSGFEAQIACWVTEGDASRRNCRANRIELVKRRTGVARRRNLERQLTERGAGAQ